MSDAADTPLFWGIVKVDLVDPARDRAEFDEWYDTLHVPEFVEQPGFRHGWRTETIDHPSALGPRDTEFAAIYEVESVAAFKDALDASPSAGHSWGVWEGRLANWSRTFYRMLDADDRDPAAKGTCFTSIRLDFEGTGEEEEEFNRWYSEIHFPEVMESPGFYRGWRFRREASEHELGPSGPTYLAYYEVESAEAFAAARDGKRPWDGIWHEHVRDWRRGYHRLLLDYDRPAHGTPNTSQEDT
jgi:hypothetical protein